MADLGQQLFAVGMNSGKLRSDLCVQNCCDKSIKEKR